MRLARTLFTLVSYVVATAGASSARALTALRPRILRGLHYEAHKAPGGADGRAEPGPTYYNLVPDTWDPNSIRGLNAGDTCAYINQQLLESSFGTELTLGNICICLSGIADAVSSNASVYLVLGEFFGDFTVRLAILVNNYGDVCTYPPGATPVCSQSDPCGFQCPAPYVQQGSQCVCAAPYTSCNGVCDLFPNGCGSAVPQNNGKRDELAGRLRGIKTHAEAQTTCHSGETVCGVPRRSVGFECLDLARTLDSCGGCMYPSPFLVPSKQGLPGKDCSVLPNALDVGCVAGNCVVRRCEAGFSVSGAGDACQADN
ncbi:hypothetical protein FA95DRAFT_1574630 [Auriscalpium vulgare]|uniref:Uncharacterized protein n=1 Tax=Auriscalpium vulgare TaxID=40419 RepID=A0ACB8RJ83_9AGAM|nr:hypothetical protein FA95DRAFT_1574630 [Auriscalpium vulgare]